MTAIPLASLATVLALLALTQRRLLWGVAVLGVQSLVLAGVYFSLAAPDVALTEAAIGFGLVTFVYLLAIRRTGKLVVAAVECPSLLYREGGGVGGLLWELLVILGRRTHRELEIVWVERSEVKGLVASGEADLAAGDLIPASGESRLPRVDILPTEIVMASPGKGPVGAVAGSREAEFLPRGGKVFPGLRPLTGALGEGRLGGIIVNLVVLRSLYLRGVLREAEVRSLESAHIAVLFAPDREETARVLAEILRELEEGGRWEGMLRRYL